MNLNKQIIVIISCLLVVTPYALGHVMGGNLQNFQYNAELVPVAPIVDGYLDDPVWEKAIPGKIEQDLVTGNGCPNPLILQGRLQPSGEMGFFMWRLNSLMIKLKRVKRNFFGKTILSST